jgi:hypothetical protein
MIAKDNLRPTEASEIAGINRTTFFARMKAGEIPFVYVGKQRFVLRSVAEALRDGTFVSDSDAQALALPVRTQLPEKLTFTCDEAAVILGMSSRALREMARRGEIGRLKGNVLRFSRFNLDNFLTTEVFGEEVAS